MWWGNPKDQGNNKNGFWSSVGFCLHPSCFVLTKEQLLLYCCQNWKFTKTTISTHLHVIVVVVVLYQKQHPPSTPSPLLPCKCELKSFESYDANSYQHPFQPGGCIITTLFFLNFLKICQKNKRPISQHSFFSQILNQNEQINFSSTQNLNPQVLLNCDSFNIKNEWC